MKGKPLLHIDIGFDDIEIVLGVNSYEGHRIVHMTALIKAISYKTVIKGIKLAMSVGSQFLLDNFAELPVSLLFLETKRPHHARLHIHALQIHLGHGGVSLCIHLCIMFEKGVVYVRQTKQTGRGPILLAEQTLLALIIYIR